MVAMMILLLLGDPALQESKDCAEDTGERLIMVKNLAMG